MNVRENQNNCILYVISFLEHWYWYIFILYYSDINPFLIDYAWWELCNIWLLLFENNSSFLWCSFSIKLLWLQKRNMMMMMMMNCFCGMVDRQKAFSLISSRDHCQRSSPSRISNTPRAGFEPAQNLSSGLVEWSYAVEITTTPRRHRHGVITYHTIS